MLKNKLSNNEFTLGSWITIESPDVAEIMSGAKYDWLVVDLEHSVIEINGAGNLIRVIELSGVSPLVRITSNDANQIKRVMDAGAHGIIVPMVNMDNNQHSPNENIRIGNIRQGIKICLSILNTEM